MGYEIVILSLLLSPLIVLTIIEFRQTQWNPKDNLNEIGNQLENIEQNSAIIVRVPSSQVKQPVTSRSER